jgi:hypothetical protein
MKKKLNDSVTPEQKKLINRLIKKLDLIPDTHPEFIPTKPIIK